MPHKFVEVENQFVMKVPLQQSGEQAESVVDGHVIFFNQSQPDQLIEEANLISE